MSLDGTIFIMCFIFGLWNVSGAVCRLVERAVRVFAVSLYINVWPLFKWILQQRKRLCARVRGCVRVWVLIVHALPTDNHVNDVDHALLQGRKLLDAPRRRYRRDAGESPSRIIIGLTYILFRLVAHFICYTAVHFFFISSNLTRKLHPHFYNIIWFNEWLSAAEADASLENAESSNETYAIHGAADRGNGEYACACWMTQLAMGNT